MWLGVAVRITSSVSYSPVEVRRVKDSLGCADTGFVIALVILN